MYVYNCESSNKRNIHTNNSTCKIDPNNKTKHTQRKREWEQHSHSFFLSIRNTSYTKQCDIVVWWHLTAWILYNKYIGTPATIIFSTCMIEWLWNVCELKGLGSISTVRTTFSINVQNSDNFHAFIVMYSSYETCKRWLFSTFVGNRYDGGAPGYRLNRFQIGVKMIKLYCSVLEYFDFGKKNARFIQVYNSKRTKVTLISEKAYLKQMR